jgi:hypothetical protein
MMHGRRKSDSAIVAVKPANNAERSAAEPVEPRAGTKGNAGQQSTRRTQSRISVSKMLARIRQIVAVDTRGRSRMRESCMYGSVRGARGDSRPYRDRREFITLLGGAAAAWPLAARAQQPGKIPRIGFLGAQSADSYASQLEGFRLGLRDLGYVEGTTIVIEYRWAEGKYERLRELVAELIRSNVDVIVTHGTPGALAAKQATTAIPIVVTLLGDPVASGIVASLARPEANITGQSFFSPELAAKRIELLKDLMPQMTRVAVLMNPGNPVVLGAELQAM